MLDTNIITKVVISSYVVTDYYRLVSFGSNNSFSELQGMGELGRIRQKRVRILPAPL